MKHEVAHDPGFPRCLTRRTVLQAVLGLVPGGLLAKGAMAQDHAPHQARPHAGDHFVFATGEHKGNLITPADLPIGGPPVTVYPMDPHSRIVRDGSRLNQVLLIHFEPEALTGDTRLRAAAGIVAYSAICTHAGCDVSDWKYHTKTLMCFCHYAEFDPRDGARVLDGPAPRRLAALPLKVVDGVLTAAGGFIGRVGFQQG